MRDLFKEKMCIRFPVCIGQGAVQPAEANPAGNVLNGRNQMIVRNTIVVASVALALAFVPSSATSDGHGMDYAIGNVADLEFAPFGDSPVQMAVLWGDPASGPSGILLKIPAGYENVPHAHSANYRAFIIEGVGLHWTEGETRADATPITSGGYWFQPANEIHTDANGGDTPGLALVIFDGPLDMIAAE